MSTDTVITIGCAFDNTPRMVVEVLGRSVNEHGVNMVHIVLPSGLSTWVKPTSLKREAAPTEPTALASFVEPTKVSDLEPGMYRTEAGDIFKVQRAKGSGNLYAKRLAMIGGNRLNEDDQVVHWEFQYAQGAIFSLKVEDRMTVDQAREFGIQYGVCCVCGITLKDAASVVRGIGPVCAKRV